MNARGSIQCPDCGIVLPEYWPKGLCPRCAFDGALESPGSDDSGIALRSSRQFGDYELLEEVARGGMGVIYRARQISLNRIVALKMILAGQFASKEEVLRFRREAEAAAHLQHPNIVRIHETGERDGHHYFSMDYIEGRTLSDIVRDGPLPAQRAAKYTRTIAEAIHYAHSQGVLHRDLKPSNVVINGNDEPRITDFGLAKRMRDDFGVTVTGQVLGSPNFMPPEQTSAKSGKIGAASDVYGVGAILYCLLTGRPPFHAERIEELLLLLRDTEPIAPRLLNASVPRDLETICLKCLEKEPARRYASGQALADELGRFMRDEPIHARPVHTLNKFWRWCRRRPA
ncbi:MAG TPA: serine/threonine-protein kinase, partial [Candidatus Acidoferrum sp.]|nr:serine/threonine-protein kinase [Candidatus Acidoferrum sp.]